VHINSNIEPKFVLSSLEAVEINIKEELVHGKILEPS
jgi:hypothetical protein